MFTLLDQEIAGAHLVPRHEGLQQAPLVEAQARLEGVRRIERAHGLEQRLDVVHDLGHGEEDCRSRAMASQAPVRGSRTDAIARFTIVVTFSSGNHAQGVALAALGAEWVAS